MQEEGGLPRRTWEEREKQDKQRGGTTVFARETNDLKVILATKNRVLVAMGQKMQLGLS